MLEVDVAGAGEEGDAVAVAQREVAVAAGEICLGGESVRGTHTGCCHADAESYLYRVTGRVGKNLQLT